MTPISKTIQLMGSAFALLCALTVSAVRADAIDDYVNEQMRLQSIPGMAVAIVKQGQLVRARGYGFANLEHRIPVHSDTIFQSGSVGKQFTAAAIMLLVEEGKLDLDQPIHTYLPNAPQRFSEITPRRLMTHTAGLPPNIKHDLRRDYTFDQMLQFCYDLELMTKPGTRWNYSNAGYVLLGLLIEKVSGQRYSEMLRERLFEPAHMTTAGVIDDLSLIPHRAAGYMIDGTTIRNHDWVSATGNSTADGRIYVSALDLAKWESAIHSRRVLKPESWTEVSKPVRLLSGKHFPYGLGWHVKLIAGQESWQHAGRWQGFSSHYIRFAADEVAIIVLANGVPAKASALAREIAGLFDPKLAAPPAYPIEDKEPTVTLLIEQLIVRTARNDDDRSLFENFEAARFDVFLAHNRRVFDESGASVREIKLFSRTDSGDDRVYRHRARLDHGIVETVVTFNPRGKIVGFEVIPTRDWTTPVLD